jgi:hypothetical protein
MLLFSERTWKHHCVTLVLPCAVILYFLAVERPKPTLRWFLVGTLSAVALLMASTSTNGVLTWWDQAAKLAQVYGAYVWAHGLLVLALVILLRRQHPSRSSMEVLAFRVQLSDLKHRQSLASETELMNPADSSTALILRSTQKSPPA